MTASAITSIINGIFTLLGAGLGGFIGYITSIKVADRREFQKAAIDFHDAFLDALMSLDPRYCCRESIGKKGLRNS